MQREEKIEYINLLEERLYRDARKHLLDFTVVTMPTFEPADFHYSYYDILTDFAYKKIKKLMVFMPPQHGKSQGSTRQEPSFIQGIDPHNRIGIISYNSDRSSEFNRDIQRIIDTPEYRRIFPNTRLAYPGEAKWIRNTDKLEIVGYRGFIRTVGVGGSLTGITIDTLIMDDLYKDHQSAWSVVSRSSISSWYWSVAVSRLHNESQQLLVFTRWHEDDLAGELLTKQGYYCSTTNPNGWVVVTYKAIKEGEPTEHDPRQDGEALWPAKHSLEEHLQRKRDNPHIFQSLYQQDPKPAEGLMYERGFIEYEGTPWLNKHKRKNYTDTADTGSDYHCSINYIETETYCYVTDLIYTKKPMEYTEPETAAMLTKGQIETAYIESNNGGRSFMRAVKEKCILLGNTKTSFKDFHQSENKQVRIFSHSSTAQNIIQFPKGWDKIWPQFYNSLTSYRKEGKNQHDDAPDVITGICENFKKKSFPYA
jgi:predicted phage terminase large subunit-like protein